ncbi:hypothetical protein ACJMK2_044338 [Sinanodonta woodiana]|uniref:Methyltransferase type 11 domain-containing protein n=1 Tax=Sinanodonta woodiana TaxID=1069815 RepID=A0ABD3W1M1_SINWO
MPSVTLKSCVVVGFLSSLFIIVSLRFFVPNSKMENVWSSKRRESSENYIHNIARNLLQERNRLSNLLNEKMQQIGRLECENARRKSVQTSESGGWCLETSMEDSGEHRTDRQLADELASFFKGKKVASFGDGPGRYQQIISDSGKVILCDAYDGAPYAEKVSSGRVKYMDLTVPQYGIPVYDWIFSLEVAEHIPHEFESIFLDNIVRHAREGVILSWAVPGQFGYSHVNTQPLSYVIDVFDKLGFRHDKEDSLRVQNMCSIDYLRNNVNVYRRKNISDIVDMEIYMS